MCGIAGFIDYRRNTSMGVLKEMVNELKHRGPDGHGEEIIDHALAQVGLGHSRLAIIDLSDNGKQPMAYKNLLITFNGEIYNYQEVKKELSSLGHDFKSGSDTEMILHAFEEWGVDCVHHFIGMFAFVILDKIEGKLWCFRDRAGVKPLFYYSYEDLFLFGSELKVFHNHPGFRKELNSDAVAAFMQYGSVPTPHCIFKNALKVKPGHFLEVDLESRCVSERKYWDVYDAYNSKKIDLSFEEAKTETAKLLKSACRYRMVSDVPVGVFLSGGFDSACVTALLQSESAEKLKTYTISVPDIGLNEAPYAADVAKHLGTDHHEYACTQREALELISDLPYFYDEPFADSSAIPTTLVSLMARKDVTVALSADAGDEIFAGYNRYDYLIRYRSKLEKIPQVVRKSMAGLMDVIPADRLPILKNKYNFSNRYEKLKNILGNPSAESIMLSLSQQFTDDQIKEVMKEGVHHLKTSYITQDLKPEFWSPLSYMLAVDYQTYLLDDILQKVDRATMSASLEGREPFLDHRIIEWAATLPDDFKYHKGVKKHMLKEIVYDYIPRELMDRPKMGFAIPLAQWLRVDLKDMVHQYLDPDILESQGVFNVGHVEKIKKEFYSGKSEYALKIWYYLMFQMWYERWMK